MTQDEIQNLTIPIPDTFQPFDPAVPITTYQRALPHWRQQNATYFVTFRLNDSIPGSIWSEMKAESDYWQSKLQNLDHTKLPPNTRAQFNKFRNSFQLRQDQITDACHGTCKLRDPETRKIVADSLTHFDGSRYDLYAYVIMPNHVHAMLRPSNPTTHPLEKILQAWKSFTAKKITSSTLWQRESYDRIIRDQDHYRKVARYILANPVKANLPLTATTIHLKT